MKGAWVGGVYAIEVGAYANSVKGKMDPSESSHREWRASLRDLQNAQEEAVRKKLYE